MSNTAEITFNKQCEELVKRYDKQFAALNLNYLQTHFINDPYLKLHKFEDPAYRSNYLVKRYFFPPSLDPVQQMLYRDYTENSDENGSPTERGKMDKSYETKPNSATNAEQYPGDVRNHRQAAGKVLTEYIVKEISHKNKLDDLREEMSKKLTIPSELINIYKKQEEKMETDNTNARSNLQFHKINSRAIGRDYKLIKKQRIKRLYLQSLKLTAIKDKLNDELKKLSTNLDTQNTNRTKYETKLKKETNDIIIDTKYDSDTLPTKGLTMFHPTLKEIIDEFHEMYRAYISLLPKVVSKEHFDDILDGLNKLDKEIKDYLKKIKRQRKNQVEEDEEEDEEDEEEDEEDEEEDEEFE